MPLPEQVSPQAVTQDQALEQRMAQARVLALLPNHRNLYMLAAGLLVGILLGPAVLGKISPNTYDAYFGSVPVAVQKLTAHDLGAQQLRQRLAEAQATSVAVEEFKAVHAPERLPFVAKLKQAERNRGRLIATLLGVLIIMVLETLPDPRATRLRSHMATARYALMALALALLLAQPQWLQGISVVYLVLILAAALVLALVPLGPRSDKAAMAV